MNLALVQVEILWTSRLFWCSFYGDLAVSYRNSEDNVGNKRFLGRLHVEICYVYENYNKSLYFWCKHYQKAMLSSLNLKTHIIIFSNVDNH